MCFRHLLADKSSPIRSVNFITAFSRNYNINDLENSSGAKSLYIKVTDYDLSWEYIDFFFIIILSFQQKENHRLR